MKKQLYKSSDNKIVFGVCGGLGEYFDIDPTILRIIVFISIVMFGSGLAPYLLAAIFMPSKPAQLRQSHSADDLRDEFDSSDW